jgi:hypothetical protein
MSPEELRAQQVAADAATRRAVVLVSRPLTWQQRRQAARAAAVARRLMHLEDNRKRGIR